MQSVRNFMLKATVTALLTSFAGTAAATQWSNVGPIQSGDVTAFVDYQKSHSIPPGDVWGGGTPQGPASYHIQADPLWVNVHRGNLAPADHVFVQLISYARNCYRGECWNTQSIAEMDLAFAEPGRFTGRLSPVTLEYQLNDGYAMSRVNPYHHELVIWINGTLYKGADGNNLRLELE